MCYEKQTKNENMTKIWRTLICLLKISDTAKSYIYSLKGLSLFFT